MKQSWETEFFLLPPEATLCSLLPRFLYTNAAAVPTRPGIIVCIGQEHRHGRPGKMRYRPETGALPEEAAAHQLPITKGEQGGDRMHYVLKKR